MFDKLHNFVTLTHTSVAACVEQYDPQKAAKRFWHHQRQPINSRSKVACLSSVLLQKRLQTSSTTRATMLPHSARAKECPQITSASCHAYRIADYQILHPLHFANHCRLLSSERRTSMCLVQHANKQAEVHAQHSSATTTVTFAHFFQCSLPQPLTATCRWKHSCNIVPNSCDAVCLLHSIDSCQHCMLSFMHSWSNIKLMALQQPCVRFPHLRTPNLVRWLLSHKCVAPAASASLG